MCPKDLSNNKTLICTRNPYDVHESWWTFHARIAENGQEFQAAQLDRDEFIKIVRENEHVYGPWVEWHNSWVQEANNNKNVYIYHFEDLVTYPEQTINKIAKFLGITVTDKHMAKILKLINLDTMKKIENNTDINEDNKVRNGKIGASLKSLSELTVNKLTGDLRRIDPIFGHVDVVRKYLPGIDLNKVSL